MQTWKTFKKQLLADPETFKEYKKLLPRYQLISQMIEKRSKLKLTQLQLAKKIGTKQSAIARLEAGNINPSFSFLEKVAKALGSKISITLQ